MGKDGAVVYSRRRHFIIINDKVINAGSGPLLLAPPGRPHPHSHSNVDWNSVKPQIVSDRIRPTRLRSERSSPEGKS